ncbi:MAG TPA: PilT/PilU family type 4a pilus ATPase [Kofleriaceae bacterium]|nr:PilT/PilU family type 4a pilus ATPase [Kofleriaceae bacterium]
MGLAELFEELYRLKGSDVHIAPGYPPTLRVRGELLPLGDERLTMEDADAMLMPLLQEHHRRVFDATGDLDWAYQYDTRGRFRVSYFRKTTGVGGVFRSIPSKIATLDDLAVPQGVRKLVEVRSGLVLVTGPTGSGKTTTLAAMIDQINRTRPVRILTIEDPIEFIHKSRKAIVTHKEIGHHVPSFVDAIRSASRENPDVILVGELRDSETMKAALQLASFGILVFASVHTNSASATIDRYVNAFSADQQPQIRGLLAESLAGIIAQQLVRKADGVGRVAVHEILFSSIALSGLIREAKPQQIPSLMQSGLADGMQPMDWAIERAVLSGAITARDGLEKALDKDTFAKVPSIASRLANES